MTLKEIKSVLGKRRHRELNEGTISRELRKRKFTTKQLTVEPEAKNSETTKDKRIEYVNWFKSNCTFENTIFVDESGFNSSLHRKRGRSEKGQKAHAKKRVLKGGNYSIVAAASPVYGLISWQLNPKLKKEEKGKKITINRFVTFIQSFLSTLKPHTHYFIADNCNQHNEAAITHMLSAQPSPLHCFHFLPPYSPDFNPIENIFNMWKYHQKG